MLTNQSRNPYVATGTGRREFLLAVTTLVSIAVTAVHAKAADLFVDRFQPFAEKFCVRCHNRELARGELDLTRYTEARHVSDDFRRWNHVIEFIRDGEMPPENELQPTLEERRVATETLEAILLEEANITVFRTTGRARNLRRSRGFGSSNTRILSGSSTPCRKVTAPCSISAA